MRILKDMLPRLASVLLLVAMVVAAVVIGVREQNSVDMVQQALFSADGYDFSFTTNNRGYHVEYIDSGFELYENDTKLVDAVIITNGSAYFDFSQEAFEEYKGFTYKDCYRTILVDDEGRQVYYALMPNDMVVRMITYESLDLSSIDVTVTESVDTTEQVVEQ